MYRSSAVCKRLGAVPGIGPITATALVAALGDGKAFVTARQVPAWLGVVPKQDSTGGKDNAQSRWINALVKRRNANIAAVAVANKNARIAWVLLTREEDYRAPIQVSG